jgi:hypothetical protein
MTYQLVIRQGRIIEVDPECPMTTMAQARGMHFCIWLDPPDGDPRLFVVKELWELDDEALSPEVRNW